VTPPSAENAARDHQLHESRGITAVGKPLATSQELPSLSIPCDISASKRTFRQIGLICRSRCRLPQTALSAGDFFGNGRQAVLRYAAPHARRVEIGRSVYYSLAKPHCLNPGVESTDRTTEMKKPFQGYADLHRVGRSGFDGSQKS
jgi:hypothetical protein